MPTPPIDVHEPVAECEAFRTHSFAAADGEVSVTRWLAIEAHVQGCDACRTRFIADAVFHRAIRGALSLDIATPSLRDRVAHIIHAGSTESAPA